MADVIAAVSTAMSVAALGVIRISGDNAQSIAEKVFKPINSEKCISSIDGYQALFGHVFDKDGNIDECVALNFKAPHSYTGENVVEFSLHGGSAVLLRTLRALFEAGARQAQAGEFTKRAFLNGKLSLTQAEAVMDVISASNANALKSAQAALGGASFRKINELKEKLVYLEALLAAYTDFPEEGKQEMDEVDFSKQLLYVQEELNKLIINYDIGAVIRNGVDCVIVGKPNVGKSTLMNLLSNSERSIVTDFAGTTRDVIEETVDLGGITLKLSDTAGIHDGNDQVEKIGIERAYSRLENAQLILVVISADSTLDQTELDILKKSGNTPKIIILNKTDLCDYPDENKLESFGEVIKISAKTGDGFEELKKAVFNTLHTKEIDPGTAILQNERQLKSAKDAYENVCNAYNDFSAGMTLDAVSVVIEDAIGNLLSLTGENVTEAVVGEVFSKFCVGK